ncbi:MAG TPA: hypothetical protein VFH47_04755 [Candidatus Thermoplasmatota archaeon]|nr:hypothetical protein [Candidatus Thermoplasmatota archaeon]
MSPGSPLEGQHGATGPPAAGGAGGWDPPEPDTSQDARKMRQLLRVVSGIVAFPAVTICLAYILFEDISDHVLHILVYGAVSAAAITVWTLAPRLAARWT